MSEFFFGLGPGHLPAKANVIAKRHGAWLTNYREPGKQGADAKRHWFACRNRGAPFDRAVADAVLADLADAGII